MISIKRETGIINITKKKKTHEQIWKNVSLLISNICKTEERQKQMLTYEMQSH